MSTYLTKLQEDILDAREKLSVREAEIVLELVSQIESISKQLYEFGEAIGFLDLVSSHAHYAHQY